MNHDVTAVIYGVITLIYSLILAFVIVAVWQDYEEINTDITKEADKLRGIINHAEELPDSNWSAHSRVGDRLCQTRSG
jgi:predicted negative regulator of RcsB-dependent stress response